MKHIIGLLIMSCTILPAGAQRVLSLDSCRALALRNNKQLSISGMKQNVAKNIRKSARTKYLPQINAIGSYMYTSKEISILNGGQKAALTSIGTMLGTELGNSIQNIGANLSEAQLGAINEQLGAFGTSIEQIKANLGNGINNVASGMNAQGQRIVDAFRTDTRNIFAGSVTVTQPIFMGGSIIAMNKMAILGEQMAANGSDAARQSTIYDTDRAYWTVVSLKQKRKLAESYLQLVKQLADDVDKMINEGVATRSEGLSVDVKVNEAEMTLTQVDDGLVLARMLLCQLCGLPLDERPILADENSDDLSLTDMTPVITTEEAIERRPELRILQNTVDMGRQATNIIRAGNLPKVALFGGYSGSNPNVFDGFQKRFGGTWNVGVLVTMPIWNWGDVSYKVRAAKGATTIAELELDEAREKVELQVTQSTFRVNESAKKLKMAKANIKRAEENLRHANLGFKEGVIQSTTVMEAQTAWLQARSQKIDAEIDMRMSQVNLKKALGMLQEQ